MPLAFYLLYLLCKNGVDPLYRFDPVRLRVALESLLLRDEVSFPLDHLLTFLGGNLRSHGLLRSQLSLVPLPIFLAVAALALVVFLNVAILYPFC